METTPPRPPLFEKGYGGEAGKTEGLRDAAGGRSTSDIVKEPFESIFRNAAKGSSNVYGPMSKAR
jgi:hypothetical protein